MKQIKLTALLLLMVLGNKAQLVVSDFETFSLSPGSYFQDTTNAPFSTLNAAFRHHNSKFGNIWYWTGGFAYTNVSDSSNGTFTNLYGVKALKGYNGSNNFVIAQDRGVIQLASAQNTVDGFYVTNTTFAYKMILLGDTANGFSRKFGDTTGTGSGTTIAQGGYPDFFKITIKGFKNGQMSSDSVEFYLADYRFQNNTLDYVIDTWQWVNTTSLGEVDSLKFWMYSSDVGQFGINTPLFFALDNFTTKGFVAGLGEDNVFASIKVYPVPFHDQLSIFINSKLASNSQLQLNDLQGRCVVLAELQFGENTLDLSELKTGVYLLQMNNGERVKHLKIVKE
jgi:hypothetical protein